jgi:hypothetical protein
VDTNGLTQDDESVIPRDQLRVLLDGTFAVFWGDNDIQDLETGQYRILEAGTRASPVTDYELKQLKSVGLVRKFDDLNISLAQMPERNEFASLAAWETTRVRSFYLNTTLPGLMLDDVRELLEDLGLDDLFHPRVRDDFVILLGDKGISYPRFEDAEKARYLLTSRAPEAFLNTVIAFVETSKRN